MPFLDMDCIAFLLPIYRLTGPGAFLILFL